MRPSDIDYGDLNEQHEITAKRPRASNGQRESRPQFTFARSRKSRQATHFNGLHRRRQNRWTW